MQTPGHLSFRTIRHGPLLELCQPAPLDLSQQRVRRGAAIISNHGKRQNIAGFVAACERAIAYQVTDMSKTSSQTPQAADDDDAGLTISPEKVCFIIIKAREFDAKDEVTEPDPGSNPSDDNDAAVLEDHEDDPVVEELTSLITSLSVDEQVDLVALTWLGRGDGGIDDWADLRAEAARAHNRRTAAYLLGIPLLADYLSEAIDQFGIECEDEE
jgi:hypothetical protein